MIVKAPLFLRAKHWHIFLPLMIVPFVSLIVFMIIIVSKFVVSHSSGPEDAIWIFYAMPIFSLLCIGTQMLWMWNVGVNLRKYISSPERKPRVKLFRVTFFLPIVYMCILPVLMANLMFGLASGHEPDPAQILPFFLLIFLGNLTMMFCFLNNNYVVAKTIKMAELQRKVSFSDFVGDFFFMLVFPIAIWFIQPRINKIVNGEEEKPLMRETIIQRDILD